MLQSEHNRTHLTPSNVTERGFILRMKQLLRVQVVYNNNNHTQKMFLVPQHQLEILKQQQHQQNTDFDPDPITVLKHEMVNNKRRLHVPQQEVSSNFEQRKIHVVETLAIVDCK